MNKEGVKANSTSVKSKRKKNLPIQETEEDFSSGSFSAEDLETEEPKVLLFSCPEQGCIKRCQRYSYLQQHLYAEKHKLAREREPLFDKAVFGYAERMEVHQVGVPRLQNVQLVSGELPLQTPLLWAGH